MIIDVAAERGRAFRRVGLIAGLVTAWCVYAARVPAGAGMEALKAAMTKKTVTTVMPGTGMTSASWLKDGEKLNHVDLAKALEQAKSVKEKADAKAEESRRAIEEVESEGARRR